MQKSCRLQWFSLPCLKKEKKKTNNKQYFECQLVFHQPTNKLYRNIRFYSHGDQLLQYIWYGNIKGCLETSQRLNTACRPTGDHTLQLTQHGAASCFPAPGFAALIIPTGYCGAGLSNDFTYCCQQQMQPVHHTSPTNKRRYNLLFEMSLSHHKRFVFTLSKICSTSVFLLMKLDNIAIFMLY